MYIMHFYLPEINRSRLSVTLRGICPLDSCHFFWVKSPVWLHSSILPLLYNASCVVAAESNGKWNCWLTLFWLLQLNMTEQICTKKNIWKHDKAQIKNWAEGPIKRMSVLFDSADLCVSGKNRQIFSTILVLYWSIFICILLYASTWLLFFFLLLITFQIKVYTQNMMSL